MKLVENLRAQLRAIGATLDDSSNESALNCDAPPGYVWRANGNPNFVIHFATNQQSWLADALRAEMPNLKMGLEKVTDEKELAEHRWNLGDDSWGAAADAPERIEWPKNR